MKIETIAMLLAIARNADKFIAMEQDTTNWITAGGFVFNELSIVTKVSLHSDRERFMVEFLTLDNFLKSKNKALEFEESLHYAIAYWNCNTLILEFSKTFLNTEKYSLSSKVIESKLREIFISYSRILNDEAD